MLKLERCKRALAVMLAVIMIAAATVAGISLFGADKSKAGVLESTFEGMTFTSATSSVFTGVNAEQNEINKLTVSGTVDRSKCSGEIVVRIGTEPAQIFSVMPGDDGKFSKTCDLNITFCSEFDNNEIPVYVSCNYGEDVHSVGAVGVVTYDYDSGILRYPEGAGYLTATGLVALTKPYVSADALLDDGKATVGYAGKEFKFEVNPMPVADAPEKGTDGVYDQVGVDGTPYTIKALLNTTAGRQYAISELGGSVTNDYGISTWVDAETTTMEFANLVPGNKYSFWVRNAGETGVSLPSAPVFLGSIVAMDAEDAENKNTFLEKYEALVVTNEKTLYPSATVTATSSEILDLITAYNALPAHIKAEEEIAEKAEYLVLSNFLAKHQNVIAAAKNAITYDALRTDFEYIDLTKAIEDFAAIKDQLGKAHLADATDAAFILELKKTVEKIDVLRAIDVNDVAKDKKYEAADYAIALIYSTAPSVEAAYNVDITSRIADFVNDYELALWMKTELGVTSDDTFDSMTLDQLETKFASLEDVEIFGQFGEMYKTSLSKQFYREIAARYIALLDTVVTNGDEAAEEIIEEAASDINFYLGYLPYESAYDLPNPAYFYDAAVKAVDVRLMWVEGNAAIEALKNGVEEIDAIANGYLASLGNLSTRYEDVYLAPTEYQDVVDEINELVDRATKEITYENALAKAYADIAAMKDGKANVDAVADRYVVELDRLTYAYDVATALVTNIENIVTDAKNETEFEKRRNSAKDELTASAEGFKNSGNYTADGKAQLDAKLAAAKATIDNLDYVAGKKIDDINLAVLDAIAGFKSVNVITVTFGTKGEDFCGSVVNKNGLPSSLSITVSKAVDKAEIEGTTAKVVTGEFSDDKAASLTDGKTVLFTIKLNPTVASGATLEEGTYVVKVLIPEEYRGEYGLQILAKDGDTVEIFKTVRAGAYLQFTVTDLSEEFYVVSDKMVNLLWLVIVLAVLLVAEIAIVVYFIIKRRKGTTTAVVAPVFGALLVSGGMVTSVAVLGALTVVGAVAAVILFVDSKKKTI